VLVEENVALCTNWRTCGSLIGSITDLVDIVDGPLLLQ